MTVSSATLAALYTSRFCYGSRAGDTASPTPSNLSAWLGGQLSMSGDPADVKSRLAVATLSTLWRDTSNQSRTETGPLATLGLSDTALWSRLQSAVPNSIRPYQEVCAAHWIRKTWSSAQIWETMSDFWHNHFSVRALDDQVVAGMWPAYDQAIRSNALGNFRALLGDTAKSAAMMQFLNLRENLKGKPNENFAREVMELHTLGIDAYFGLTTPSGQAGNGYSDQDVTQAARVLTGWTIANGSFSFNSNNHDTGTKQLLGLTLSNGGVSEGETLLDFLANHPATALHIAKKLYLKFVSDVVPVNSPLIVSLVSQFLATKSAPNQIAQLIAVIARSDEFAQSTGMKFKTPMELTVSWLRALGSEFVPQRAYDQLGGVMIDLGARLYDWITPEGMPDVATAWISSDGMLTRWNFPEKVCSRNDGMALSGGLLATYPLDPETGAPGLRGLAVFVSHIASTVVPGIGAGSLAALQAFAQLPKVLGSSAAYSSPTALRDGVGAVLAAALALPEFQIR